MDDCCQRIGETIPKKKCTKCLSIKIEEEFHNRSNGTKMAHCKKCHNKQAAEYREKNRDVVRSRDKERNERPDRVASRKSYRINKRKQWNAKSLLGYHVSVGNINPLPCFVCGKKAEAHHPNYDAPLDVMWLCPTHHKQAHALGKELCQTT